MSAKKPRNSSGLFGKLPNPFFRTSKKPRDGQTTDQTDTPLLDPGRDPSSSPHEDFFLLGPNDGGPGSSKGDAHEGEGEELTVDGETEAETIERMSHHIPHLPNDLFHR